jgi:hypothetical protein
MTLRVNPGHRGIHRQAQRPPQSFVWTAKASDILENVTRVRQALDNR